MTYELPRTESGEAERQRHPRPSVGNPEMKWIGKTEDSHAAAWVAAILRAKAGECEE